MRRRADDSLMGFRWNLLFWGGLALLCATMWAIDPYWPSALSGRRKAERRQLARAEDTLAKLALRAAGGAGIGLAVCAAASISGLRLPRRLQHLDQMHHPLSNPAAVVAGFTFLPLFGCATMLAVNREWLTSSAWWWTVTTSLTIVTISMAAYFNPRGKAAFVPVVLSGVFLLTVVIYYMVFLTRPRTPVTTAGAAYRIAVMAIMWIIWASTKVAQLYDWKTVVRPTPPPIPRGEQKGDRIRRRERRRREQCNKRSSC